METNNEKNQKSENLNQQISLQADTKIAQVRLAMSELQQEAILNNIPDMIWLKDSQSRFIVANDSFGKSCGFKPEELIGKTDFDICSKEVALIRQSDDQEVMSSKKRKIVEEKTSDPQGKIKWIETIKTPIFSEDGKVIGTTGVARDITERKKIEERSGEVRAELEIRVKVRTAELTSLNEELRREIKERQHAEKELKNYHEKLESLVADRTKALELEIESRKAAETHSKVLRRQVEMILGTTKTGLDIIDQNYYLRYVDPTWAQKYGDYAGKKCFEYFMDRTSVCPNCALKEAFRTKKIVVSEEVLVKENNRLIEVTTMPYQDESGEWLVAEINIDITAKKKIDNELRQYREHLEDLVKVRTNALSEEIHLHRNAELEKSKLNQELIKSYDKLKSVSLVDAQTGLYNYRYLRGIIEAEFHQARRYAQNLSIIMLDVDYFKSINDVYGVNFGDLVLKQLARQLKKMVRKYDILVRYGGEEFIIVSPRLNREQALNLAQRLLSSLNIINFGNKKHGVKLKLSLAAVSFPDDRVKAGIDLINSAVQVLNRAKDHGGNRAYSCLDLKKSSKDSGKISKSGEVKNLKNTIDRLTKQSKQGLNESIFAFAKTIELKDHYTGEHVESTVHYATEIAKGLSLTGEEKELIKQAAILHDLGKIGISENILLKKGKLNRKEFDEIKKHPQIGADIIRPIQFLHGLIPFIFYHHERWDGKGYPSGIKGEDIPIGARVIAIADVYQALISDRPYHKAFSKKMALEIIKKASGKQFDPRIVNIFLDVISHEK